MKELTKEQTDKIFNTITANGCREMGEDRFYQAVNEAIHISSQLEPPIEAVVSCAKCNRYKFTLKEAVKWNHQYLAEVFDNREYQKMINDEYVGGEYKQLIVEIRYLLNN